MNLAMLSGALAVQAYAETQPRETASQALIERYTALMRRYHKTQMRRTRILGRALRNPWINRLDALLPSKLVSTLFSPLVGRIHAAQAAGRRAPGRPRYDRRRTAD